MTASIPITSDHGYLVRSFAKIAAESSYEVVDVLYSLFMSVLDNSAQTPKCIIINVAEMYELWLIHIDYINAKDKVNTTPCKIVSMKKMKDALMCVAINITYADAVILLNDN